MQKKCLLANCSTQQDQQPQMCDLFSVIQKVNIALVTELEINADPKPLIIYLSFL